MIAEEAKVNLLNVLLFLLINILIIYCGVNRRSVIAPLVTQTTVNWHVKSYYVCIYTLLRS